MKWNATKKAEFLEALRAGGSIIAASSAVGYRPSSLYKRRYADEQFDKEWDEALRDGEKVKIAILEAEADRRGVEGYLKPVYHNGTAVGAERRYSDVLLIVRLKALAPHKYKERPPDDTSVEDRDFDRMTEVLERTQAHRATFKPNGNGKATNGNGHGD